MATEPASINGNANPSPAAANPSVTSPAAITPTVSMPTSFIIFIANANGIIEAPNAAIPTAPLNINGRKEPINAPATPNTVKPPAITTSVPMPTSFIKLRPTAIGINAAPNTAIAAAPFIIAVEPFAKRLGNFI